MRDFFAKKITKIISYIFYLPTLLVLLLLKFIGQFSKQSTTMMTRIFSSNNKQVESTGALVRFTPPNLRNSWSVKTLIVIGTLIFLSNLMSYQFLIWKTKDISLPVASLDLNEEQQLYLIDFAAQYIRDISGFETKVRSVAERLNIPPEWLMAVMYTESRFNPSVRNHKGSGAVGLIQFMVPALTDLNSKLKTSYSGADIERMDAGSQMELVYEYLNTVSSRHGHFRSLTDLYLGILYPRAMNKNSDYVLFANPSRKYKMNRGLDENRDGKVTVGDIDRRMQRVFPSAYLAEK